MAFRLDIGTLGKAERTPQGGFKVPAYLTRSGVFEYHTDDGKTIKEYRPPEEVFKADTLGTLPDAPVTNDHPPEHVDPENFKRYSVGHVTGSAKQDGDKVSASLIVQDADMIGRISKGRQEVSCGYHCDVEEKPGVTPSGEAYDRVQRNIKYNHVAIVDDGRAGPQVRLRLDHKGNAVKPLHREYRMDSAEHVKKYERIDGIEYELGTEPHTAAAKRRDSEDQKAKQDYAKLVARCDVAEAKLKQATEALAIANSPERLDRAVNIRTRLIGKAAGIIGKDFKADGMTNRQIRAAVVDKVFPGVRADGRIKNPEAQKEYADAMFLQALKMAPEAKRVDSAPKLGVPDHLKASPEQLRGDSSAPSTIDAHRQRRNDELEARHRQPLAVSKSNPMKPIDGFPALQSSMLETMK